MRNLTRREALRVGLASAVSLMISCRALPEGHEDAIRRLERDGLEPQEAQRRVNGLITYDSDQEVYGVDHYVASPALTLRRGKGDCEDFSLLFLSLLKPSYLPERFPYLLYLQYQKPVIEVRMITGQPVMGPEGQLITPAIPYPVFAGLESAAHAIGIYRKEGKYGLGGQNSDFTPPQFDRLEDIAAYQAQQLDYPLQWGVQVIRNNKWRTTRKDLDKDVEWLVEKQPLHKATSTK